MAKQNSGGFTLIEMLLSLAIFAMLGMATYSVLNNTIAGKSAIEEQATQLTELQTAMMFLENDLQQVAQRQVRLNGEAPSKRYFIAEPYLLDSDELGFAFVRDGWVNPAMILPRSEMQTVGYRIKEQILERLYFNFVDADVGEEPRVQPLLRGVSELKLQYYHENRWQDELPTAGLPLLVKLQFLSSTFGEIERVFNFVEETIAITTTNGAASAGVGTGNSNDAPGDGNSSPTNPQTPLKPFSNKVNN